MNTRSTTAQATLGAAALAGIWWVATESRDALPRRDNAVATAPADTSSSAAHDSSVATVPADSSSPLILAAPESPTRRSNLVDDTIARIREAALELQDPVERETFLQNAARGVPRALYEGIAEALSEAPRHSVEAELLREVLVRWAWEEPTNAAFWALDQPDHPYRQEALALAAQAWAKLDPAQLLSFAAELSPTDREWVLLRSGDFLGRTDPALFAVWQQAIQPGRERDQLQLAITREWARRDPETLVAALAENAGPEFDEWRQLTIAGLATRLTTMEGPDAARFVTEKIPPGPAQTQAAMGAVVAWARQDPAAASQWVESFPAGDLRARASQILLGSWLRQDATAAQAYARSLPAGPVADGARERVAQFLSAKDGREAVAWAEQIGDPERRERALAFVLAESSRRDPEGLRQLLQQRPELSRVAPQPDG